MLGSSASSPGAALPAKMNVQGSIFFLSSGEAFLILRYRWMIAKMFSVCRLYCR